MAALNPDAKRLCALLSEREIRKETITESQWENLIALAERNQLAPALYAVVRARGMSVPDTCEERLKANYLTATKRNLMLFNDLDKILRAFDESRIEVVLLKGAWLAKELYENIGLRIMADVDLWIKRSRLDDAKSIMLALGYSSGAKETRPQALQDEFGGETGFSKPGSTAVELHWKLFRGEWIRHTASIDEGAIRERTVPFGSENIRKVTNEDGLLHICIHLAVNHQMSRAGLRTLMDIHLMQRKCPIDWAAVARRALEWRVSAAAWLVLKSMEEIFGDPGSQLPLDEIEPSAFRRTILKSLVPVSAILSGRGFESRVLRALYLLALPDRLSDAAFLLWRALFPERSWLTLRYGMQGYTSWRVALKRFLHPFLVIIRRGV